MNPAQRLITDAARLGVTLGTPDAERLITLLDELERWNRTYNLTAIVNRDEMVTHHLLDSLAVHPDLVGSAIADVGTGAGFPGLPLAIVNPERQFTLIDSNGKKVRFVSHAARTLGLANVDAIHARVESLKPKEPFDTVLTRAFASLSEMLTLVAPLTGPQTAVIAMKGKWPQEEVEALPAGWQVAESRDLQVPGLHEARCMIKVRRGPVG